MRWSSRRITTGPRLHKVISFFLVLFDIFFDELNDIAGIGAGGEDGGDAGGLQSRDVLFGDDAAPQHQDVVDALFSSCNFWKSSMSLPRFAG